MGMDVVVLDSTLIVGPEIDLTKFVEALVSLSI